MKLHTRFAILLSLLVILIGCKKDASDTTGPTVAASEQWAFVMDNDSSNHGQTTFAKQSDGTVTSNATWYFLFQGATVQCPFEGGAVTIVDTVISVTAHGTATNPAAPSGYQTSPFTVNVTGSASGGRSSGVWTIAFSTMGWPTSVQGTFTATRTSGSGVTK